MERFEESLKGLAITDKRTREKIAPFLKDFLVASQQLQRVLTPLDASVHAAASRSHTKRDSPMSSVYWISVFDRVGLFKVDDSHVARLVDAALRYVWRKESVDGLISAVDREGNRIVAQSRRLEDRAGESDGEVVNVARTAGGEDLPPLQLMTLPALRARVAYSTLRPPMCVPNASALSSAKAVIAAVAASSNPAAQCRVISFRACTALQAFLIARAGLTDATLEGGTDVARAVADNAAAVGVEHVGDADGAVTDGVASETAAAAASEKAAAAAGVTAAAAAGETAAAAVGDSGGEVGSGVVGEGTGTAAGTAPGGKGGDAGGDGRQGGRRCGRQGGR